MNKFPYFWPPTNPIYLKTFFTYTCFNVVFPTIFSSSAEQNGDEAYVNDLNDNYLSGNTPDDFIGHSVVAVGLINLPEYL